MLHIRHNLLKFVDKSLASYDTYVLSLANLEAAQTHYQYAEWSAWQLNSPICRRRWFLLKIRYNYKCIRSHKCQYICTKIPASDFLKKNCLVRLANPHCQVEVCINQMFKWSQNIQHPYRASSGSNKTQRWAMDMYYNTRWMFIITLTIWYRITPSVFFMFVQQT